jgi:dolichol kinase
MEPYWVSCSPPVALTDADIAQAFHPFYVFQIASLILWSLDEYYYYAIAIFLMSFGSITTTLIETRAVRTIDPNRRLDG